MGAFRHRGSFGIHNILSGGVFPDLNSAHSAIPATTGLMTIDELLLHAADARSERQARDQFNSLLEEITTTVTFNEMMHGVRGVFGPDNRLLDTATFDWLTPFKVKGIWMLTPMRINEVNRQIRDRVLGLLRSTRLPSAIAGMMRLTRQDYRERGAVLLPGGRIGRVVRGQRYEVSFRPRDNVHIIGEVHTHPPSEILAPPSYPDDFRRNRAVVLVAESSGGRLWVAFWPRHAMLLGRISGQELQLLDTADPHHDTVYSFS